MPNVEQFIDLLAAVPFEGSTGSLSYVMSEWTKHQSKFLRSKNLTNFVVVILWFVLACQILFVRYFVHLLRRACKSFYDFCA